MLKSKPRLICYNPVFLSEAVGNKSKCLFYEDASKYLNVEIVVYAL